MCGVAGFVGKGTHEELRAMAQSLEHRGPDAHGIWLSPAGTVGFAHTRLAVIDLSQGAIQPMHSSMGRIHVIFNGEIYNYRELRAELTAYPFKTSSDTEVILAAYVVWGVAGLRRLSGMFAFALYDEEQDLCLLARDRFGKKPMYWTRQNGTLVFGSELKVFEHSANVARDIDPRSVALYMAREYVPTPRTIFKNIHKLEPGTVLKYHAGEVSLTELWPMREDTVGVFSQAEALQLFDQKLSAAVERRMVADVPLGVFLSGGLDSSTVAYYAAQTSERKIKTFSIGFQEADFDESRDAELVARHLGTEHCNMQLSVQEALELIPTIPEVFDEPVADASVLPTLLLSRFAREQVTVALGGDGADELLLGYQTFQAEMYASMWAHMPQSVRGIARVAVSALPASQGYFSPVFKAQKFINDFDDTIYVRHLQWLGSFREGELQDLLQPGYRNEAKNLYQEELERNRGFQDTLTSLSYMYLRTYLMDDVLVKVDRASMKYALEVRTPFLDTDLASFLLSLDSTLKFRGGKGKYLLRALMRGRLPASVLGKKKQGFATPLAAWLRGPLKPLMTDVLSPARLKRDGFFDEAAVARLLADHVEERRDNRKQLWTLMTFQLWYDRWMT